jgi:hypothetical protein
MDLLNDLLNLDNSRLKILNKQLKDQLDDIITELREKRFQELEKIRKKIRI